MKTLTNEQARVIEAFLECFDLYTTGVWQDIKAGMIIDFGIKDPEIELEDAKEALRNG